MPYKYDLRPLTFEGVSGITEHGTLVPNNFVRCFYEMVIDNIHTASNTIVIYDTIGSGERKRVTLGSGQKHTETADLLTGGNPVFAPLEEGSYLGVSSNGPYNFSGHYADEEGKLA